MEIPKMKQPPRQRKVLEVFGGYEHKARIPEGSWYQMENLTSDGYPLLMPRKRRGSLPTGFPLSGVTGLVSNQGICLTMGSCFYLPDGRAVDMGLDNRPKNLVNMGAYVLIFPDKKWINVAQAMAEVSADVWGSMENRWQGAGVEVSGALSNGDPFCSGMILTEKPETPQDGQLWRDFSRFPAVLKQWSESAGMWVEAVDFWVKLEAPGIGKGFAEGDALRILNMPSGVAELDEYVLVSHKAADDSFLVVRGKIIKDPTLLTEPLILERCLPEMDLVMSCGNRLWGCRFGMGQAGVCNEIYASRLGDFKNFYSFQGISTDSYAVSVGVDGPFTGCIDFQGRPVFFKEHALLEIFGSYPETYRLQATVCDGVAPECQKSLAIVNNVLYYKGSRDVFRYDGALPVAVGSALEAEGYTQAVGGSAAGKYYISMRNAQGWELFALDTVKGLWHREDDLQALALCSSGKELYCLTAGQDRIVTLLGSGEPWEEQVTWCAESGQLGLSLPESKYISRLNLRLCLGADARMQVSVSYDDSDAWEHLYSLQSTCLRSFTLPIRPKRCDHMRLRLAGVGEAKIYSIVQTVEQGSDLF